MDLATISDVIDYARDQSQKKIWVRAMQDIFYFVEHFVPKNLFDLKKAAEQQLMLLQAVQEGEQYFIVRAPRKGGKTILVAIIVCWLTLRNQEYRVFILSGSLAQAHWMYEYCTKILWPSGAQNASRRSFFSQFLVGPPTKSRLDYKLGGWILYTAASELQVNAPTADCLVNDEFILIPRKIMSEAWPMIRGSSHPMRLLLSTVIPGEEQTELFLDILDDASEGKNPEGFRKFEWMAIDCPFLQTAAAKKDSRISGKILDEEMFETQYNGKLPTRAGKVFPRTFIREAFKPLDSEKPGYLIGGATYDSNKLEFRGEGKGSVDWGFDHDTVMIEGYRGLDGKIILMKMMVESGISGTDWANRAEKDSLDYKILHWYCDAAGAFQNRELVDRGLAVTKRAFQKQTEGKEWMIGASYYWLQKRNVVIPDIPEFEILKTQLGNYRRGEDGKPIKKDDHSVDAFILFLSGWNPSYEEKAAILPEIAAREISSKTDWSSFNSENDAWMPESWRDRKEELTRPIWKK